MFKKPKFDLNLSSEDEVSINNKTIILSESIDGIEYTNFIKNNCKKNYEKLKNKCFENKNQNNQNNENKKIHKNDFQHELIKEKTCTDEYIEDNDFCKSIIDKDNQINKQKAKLNISLLNDNSADNTPILTSATIKSNSIIINENSQINPCINEGLLTNFISNDNINNEKPIENAKIANCNQNKSINTDINDNCQIINDSIKKSISKSFINKNESYQNISEIDIITKKLNKIKNECLNVRPILSKKEINLNQNLEKSEMHSHIKEDEKIQFSSTKMTDDFFSSIKLITTNWVYLLDYNTVNSNNLEVMKKQNFNLNQTVQQNEILINELKKQIQEYENNSIILKNSYDLINNTFEDYKINIPNIIKVINENLKDLQEDKNQINKKYLHLIDNFNKTKKNILNCSEHIKYIKNDLSNLFNLYKYYIYYLLKQKAKQLIYDFTKILFIHKKLKSNLYEGINKIIKNIKINFDFIYAIYNKLYENHIICKKKYKIKYKKRYKKLYKKKYKKIKSSISDSDLWDCFKKK